MRNDYARKIETTPKPVTTRHGGLTPVFDGPAYDPALDHDRLRRQLGRVWDLMRDGRWRTLYEIAEATGDPETSTSAQLRHLRKPRFGGYVVEKRRRTATGGTWEYRLLTSRDEARPWATIVQPRRSRMPTYR